MKSIKAVNREREKTGHGAGARTGIGWFLVLFVVCLAVGNLLLSLPWVDAGFVAPWTAFNAAGASALSRWVGMHAVAQGTRVIHDHGSMDILTGCNGVEALLILISACLAFPSPWRRRLLGVAAGTIAVLGANLLRLLSLIAIANFFPAWLEFFHIYVWQTLMVLIAFALFALWGIRFAQDRPAVSPPGGA